ncbi:hypothetical protein TIFTF001_019115 [Ficus carica]|uniref:Uncharacterized protein n=1 Tax=Ficus carica TaxID=3494 RepID=A0AA88AB19_FICCA|nr:hypothetical protein TIFTF001_019115 [Ficus carica]
MKGQYLPELNELYQKIAAKLQQHDSLRQQPISPYVSKQYEKVKLFKFMLERAVAFFQKLAFCLVIRRNWLDMRSR